MEYVNGYLDDVEHKVAAFHFVYGTVLCANRRALESGIPMSSDTRNALISMLHASIDQNPASVSARIGSPAIQILLLERVNFDFKDMDLVGLDSLLETVKEIECFAALAIQTSMSDETKQKCVGRVERARKVYTERVKFIAEHTQSDDLAGIDPSIKLLRQSDVDSLGPGQWMTDNIVYSVADTASKLDDGITETIIIDPSIANKLLHSDMCADELLQHMGFLQGWQENDEKKQVRAIIPISDGMLSASDVGDDSSHWTTDVMEFTKDEGSEELQIRSMHFNSIKSNQIFVARKLREKIMSIMSLLDSNVSIIFSEVEEVETPQQQDGFTCGDRVIATTQAFAQIPYGTVTTDISSHLTDVITEEVVAEIRELSIQSLADGGLGRVLCASTRFFLSVVCHCDISLFLISYPSHNRP